MLPAKSLNKVLTRKAAPGFHTLTTVQPGSTESHHFCEDSITACCKMLPSPGRKCHCPMSCSVILTYLLLLRQKPVMAIWDFFQSPVTQPWPPWCPNGQAYTSHFWILKSYISTISWLLFLLSSPSFSNLVFLPQPLGHLAHVPSSGISSSSRAPEGLQQGTRQGIDWESQRCCWSFSGSPEPVSRIQAVPDRTDPHPRRTPNLPSLQVLLFWESSLSLSNPAHSYCSATTASCSLCNGLSLPGCPHQNSLWEPAGTEELWRPHRLTSPPQTLWAALSQVLNSPEEQTQTHQGGIWFFLSTYCGPAIIHLGITLSLLIILILKQTMPEGLHFNLFLSAVWALLCTCVTPLSTQSVCNIAV